MIKIKEATLDKVIVNLSFDNVSQDYMKEDSLKEYFARYSVLSNYSEKFPGYDEKTLFYNRYFWFLQFLVASERLNGFDAGLEQLELKILEEGADIPEIDWDEVENISIEGRK